MGIRGEPITIEPLKKICGWTALSTSGVVCSRFFWDFPWEPQRFTKAGVFQIEKLSSQRLPEKAGGIGKGSSVKIGCSFWEKGGKNAGRGYSMEKCGSISK
jgi:hypothetical protein